MKALSVIQPWASLIVLGAKRFETRSWQTDYRGPLVIHASKKRVRDTLDLACCEPFRSALGLEEWERNADTVELPHGAALGVVEVLDCHPIGECGVGADQDVMMGPDEWSFGDYRPGRWAWELRVVSDFKEPVPFAGRLGLWEFPDALIPAGRDVLVKPEG